MKRRCRIAFVGNYQYHCGSSNTLLGYVKAGKAAGYDIRVSEFGYADKTIKSIIPVADKDWKPDLLVIVYESYPFLSEETIDEIRNTVPRSKRLLIDPDGKYSDPCSAGNDSNHSAANSYRYWTGLYDSLADIILQPFIKKRPKSKKKAHSFLYFGMDNQLPDLKKVEKDYDLLYVGNNWYRWPDFKKLITKIAPARRLKRIGLIGRYWDEEIMPGFETATASEPSFLKQNRITPEKSAPYGQLEKSMSRGRLNPILIRPILYKLKFVTPRMFETFNAETIPLIPGYFNHARDLYGEEIKRFILGGNPADDILKIIDNYKYYQKLAQTISHKLKSGHSYESRIKELMRFI